LSLYFPSLYFPGPGKGVDLKSKIILAAVITIVVSAVTWALDDTPANRSGEVDRYFTKYPLQKRVQQSFEPSTRALPPGLREQFTNLIISSINFSTLEKTMKDQMIKYFTADELKTLADSDDPGVRRSIVGKSSAYMSEVGRTFEVETSEALTRANPDIIKVILNDGGLGTRVKELYSAIAAKDEKKRYEMETPPIRETMSFDEWKRDTGPDNLRQQTARKFVQGELDKICSCSPWAYESGPRTFRCVVVVRGTTEDNKGRRKSNRFLEMWESVDGEWYYGMGDPRGLEDCP
jgi:hypothetical protein